MRLTMQQNDTDFITHFRLMIKTSFFIKEHQIGLKTNYYPDRLAGIL